MHFAFPCAITAHPQHEFCSRLPPMRLLAATLLLAACASGTSGGRPETIPQPEIRVERAGSVFFGSGSSAPVTLAIDITNRASVPIVLEELDLSSPDMVQWGIRPMRRLYNETIAPGATHSVTLVATAVTRMRDPSEPLTIRTFVSFEAGGRRWRELVRR